MGDDGPLERLVSRLDSVREHIDVVQYKMIVTPLEDDEVLAELNVKVSKLLQIQAQLQQAIDHRQDIEYPRAAPPHHRQRLRAACARASARGLRRGAARGGLVER